MRLSDWLLSWRKNTELGEALQSLETELQEKLIPVEPRPQFVYDLRQSLVQQITDVEMASTSQQQQVLQTGLLVTSGILGSIIVVIASIRGLVSLIGGVGLLISWLRQDSQDSIASSSLSH